MAGETIADGQLSEDFGSFTERHSRMHVTNVKTTYDIDDRDDDPCNRIASNEFTRTVHSPEEVGLSSHLFAASLRFFLIDGTGAQVGIDRHLTSRHTIQRKARSNFTDTRSTFGDHHELDHEDDHKQMIPTSSRSPATNSPNA